MGVFNPSILECFSLQSVKSSRSVGSKLAFNRMQTGLCYPLTTLKNICGHCFILLERRALSLA